MKTPYVVTIALIMLILSYVAIDRQWWEQARKSNTNKRGGIWRYGPSTT